MERRMLEVITETEAACVYVHVNLYSSPTHNVMLLPCPFHSVFTAAVPQEVFGIFF